MKIWKGLLRKEWALMKWRLVFFVLITSAIQYLGVNRLVYGLPEDFYASIQPIIALCFMLHLAMAVSLLFNSLGKEMGRPDIWLHSPASVRQLVCRKVFTDCLDDWLFAFIVRNDCSYLLLRARWGVSHCR